jgi:hypothetical protein
MKTLLILISLTVAAIGAELRVQRVTNNTVTASVEYVTNYTPSVTHHHHYETNHFARIATAPLFVSSKDFSGIIAAVAAPKPYGLGITSSVPLTVNNLDSLTFWRINTNGSSGYMLNFRVNTNAP